MSHIMSQSSRFRSLFVSALFALPVVAEPLLSGTLWAAEEKKIEFPAASQHATVRQRVGLTDIEVDYSRPNRNDREIFGGLVPWDKVWRTGANAPTRIKFSSDVKFGDMDIAAGEYALYTIPKSNEWTIILSKKLDAPYQQEADVARVTGKPVSLEPTMETFTIGFQDLRVDSATMYVAWDKTAVGVHIKTND